MIEYVALVLAVLALGLNVMFVNKFGKILQATNAAQVAFEQIKKDAQDSRKTIDEAKYYLDKVKKAKA